MSALRGPSTSRWTWLLLALLALSAVTASAQEGDTLLVPIGNALVDGADGNWAAVSRDLDIFTDSWRAHGARGTAEAHAVDVALAEARRATEKANTAPSSVGPALSSLSHALDSYVTVSQGRNDSPLDAGVRASLASGTAAVAQAVRATDVPGAVAALGRFAEEWARVENDVRAVDPALYGRIETGMAQARAAVRATPPNLSLADAATEAMTQAIADHTVAGPAPSAGASIQDLMGLLEKSRDSLRQGDGAAASAALAAFTDAWPAAEGAVRSASAAAYSSIENAMIEAQAELLSGPSRQGAAATTIQGMIDTLAALGGGGHYTAVDAGLVLLREGLEALLVLVALLAMLSKSGQQKGKAYVWTGAGVGLLLSIGLAVVLRLVLSASSGGMARESLEGFVGLFAVALMLTVGAWLHRNSSIKAWNAYIKSRVGDAIAAGRQWSLFAVAGLAILREGAETVIFLAGMAPFLSAVQLLAGIGGALLILVAAGFAVIKFSVRLPIHHLFLVATIVIFYLAFKIAGESVHSLQVAGILPARFSLALPSVGFLGMFPTWETFVLQLAVALIVVTQIVVTEARRSH